MQLDPNEGIKIREAKKTTEFVPSISVTASHDDFVKILTQKLDLATAETFGICHVRNWGNSTAKIELDTDKVIDTKLVGDMVDLKDSEILGDLEVENPEVICCILV